MTNVTNRLQGKTKCTTLLLGGTSAMVVALSMPALAQQTIFLDLNFGSPEIASANVTDYDTAVDNDQPRAGLTRARIIDGTATSTTDDTVTSSSAEISDNLLRATSRANLRDFEGEVTTGGNTIGVLSAQLTSGRTISNIARNELEVSFDGTSSESVADLSGNTIAALTTVNAARNLLRDDVDANLDDAVTGGDLLTGTLNPDATPQIDIDGGTAVVAGNQTITGQDGTARQAQARLFDNTISINPDAPDPDADRSRLSINENRLVADLTGNRASLGADLGVDTNVEGSFGAFSQQVIRGDGDAGVSLAAVNTASQLSIDIGDVGDSTVEVSDNTISSNLRGNVTERMMPLAEDEDDGDPVATPSGSFVVVDANSIGSVSSTNETSFDGAELSTQADFTAVTQQVIDDEDDSGLLLARTLNSELDAQVGTVGADDDPVTLELDSNAISASAVANTGNTLVRLTGTNIETTATSVTDQAIRGTAVEGRVENAAITANVGEEIVGSRISIDENELDAVARGNDATTRLEITAGALVDRPLDRPLAQPRGLISFDPGDSTDVTTDRFDFSLVNRQSVDAGSDITASADSVLQIDAEDAASIDGGISDTTLSISGNEQSARASANRAENVISPEVVDGEEGDSTANEMRAFTGLANLQEALSDVTADSDLSIELPAAVSGSTVIASDNVSEAVASRNQATNRITVAATDISGDTPVDVDNTNDFGVIRFDEVTDPTQPRDVLAAHAIGSNQVGEGETVATANLDIRNNDQIAGTTGLQSSALISESNVARAIADGNTVSNTLVAAAETDQERTSMIGAFQDQSGSLSAEANLTGNFSLGVEDSAMTDGSTARLADNQSIAQAVSNEAQTRLEHTGTNVTGPVTGAANIGSGQEGGASTDERLQAAVGVATLQVSDAEVTAEAESDLSFSGNRASSFLSPPPAADVIDSSIAIDSNATQAIARSNFLTREGGSNGDSLASLTVSGENVDGTSAAFGRQEASGLASATADSTATIDLDTAGLVLGGLSITDSALSVSGNITSAVAAQNTAALASEIDSVNLSGEAVRSSAQGQETASVVFDESDDIRRVRGDNILFMEQTTEEATTATATGTASILGSSPLLADTLTTSSTAIDGNIVFAESMANRNNLSLSIVAEADASDTVGALANHQSALADVTSSASFTALTDLSPGIVGGELATSSASISDNIVLSEAGGNSSVARLRSHGGTLSGVSDDLDERAELSGNTDRREVTADQVLSSRQEIGAAVDSGAELIAGIRGITDFSGAAAERSSVTLSANIAESRAIGVESDLTLDVGAATTRDGTAALHNEQRTVEDGNPVSSRATIGLDVTGEGLLTTMNNSAVGIDGNLALSSAIGFDAELRSTIGATSVSVADGLFLSEATVGDTDEVHVESPNLLSSTQVRTLADSITSEASLTADIETGGVIGLALDGSSASISGNIVDSTAIGNRVDAEHILDAATTLGAGGAVATWQENAGALTSTVTVNGTIGSGFSIGGGMDGSAASLDDNIGVARAVANDARHDFQAMAGTDFTGLSGAASVTAGGGADNQATASADRVVLNGQRNTGDVSATVQGALNANAATLGGTSMQASSGSVSGNQMVASAVGNRASSTLEVSRTASLSGASAAMGNSQYNSGSVSATANGVAMGVNNNSGMQNSSTRINGNSVSASATGNSSVSRLRSN